MKCWTREEMQQKKSGYWPVAGRPNGRFPLRTGEAALSALLSRGYSAVLIDPDTCLPQQLQDVGIDVVFIALHGQGVVEDGTVQGLLEVMRIPHSGSGVRGFLVWPWTRLLPAAALSRAANTV